jgi:hypothetical protein
MNARAAAELEIRFLTSGTSQVEQSLTAIQRRIHDVTASTIRIGQADLLSGSDAARQAAGRTSGELAKWEMNRLATTGNNFKIAATGAAEFTGVLGQLNPRLVTLGARLTGLDPTLLRLGAGLGVLGLAAGATFSLMTAEIDKARAAWVELERIDPGRFGTVLNSFLGITPGEDFARSDARKRAESDQLSGRVLNEMKPEDWEQTFKDEVATRRQAGLDLRGEELRALRDQIKTEVEERNKLLDDELNKKTRDAEELEKRQADARAQLFKEYMVLVKAAKLGDETARKLLPDMEAAYNKSDYGRAGMLAQQYEEQRDKARQIESLRQQLDSARNQQRALQMRGVEQGAAPWRDLGNLNWFADVGNAGSQAEMLDQFRATNKLSLPDSVEQQMKELQQREVDEMAKLTSAITSLEQRITNAGGSTADTWSTSGAL